jgi:hypothetical protein
MATPSEDDSRAIELGLAEAGVRRWLRAIVTQGQFIP